MPRKTGYYKKILDHLTTRPSYWKSMSEMLMDFNTSTS